MSLEQLKARTRRDLADMAKRHAVNGWHGMRKDELIDALLKVLPQAKSPQTRRSEISGRRVSSARVKSKAAPQATANGKRRTTGAAVKDLKTRYATRALRLNGSRILKSINGNGSDHDCFSVEVHDSHWIHAHWNLTRKTLARAEAALALEWHQSIPIIRVFDVMAGEDDTSTTAWVCDVEIHGEVDNWFVPVSNPPRTYRLHIGYLAPSGNFFVLARSNQIKTPRPRSSGKKTKDWGNGNSQSESGSKPLKTRKLLTNGNSGGSDSQRHNGHSTAGNGNGHGSDEFTFEVHAELIVHGSTHPHAELTLLGEPVSLDSDGGFSLRFALPEGRQIIPAVAVTPNGAEQRTIVLGVERNTKKLEPQNLDELQM